MLSNNMLKFFKEIAKDFNEVQNLLNEMGVYTTYHHWGTSVHYTEQTLSTHINNTDDRQNTISKKDR